MLKQTLLLAAAGLLLAGCAQQTAQQPQGVKTLKELFLEVPLVGGTLNQWQVQKGLGLECERPERAPEAEMSVIRGGHFNCATAENCMKSEVINPANGVFDFTLADQFVEYCQKNNLTIIGHSPIWYCQQAPWFCVEADGQTLVCADTLKARIKAHIDGVMGHFKGKIKGYDVVNEAIEDNGSWRDTNMDKIIPDGEWIDWAFECAQKADPDAELYYNDYSTGKPAKRQAIVNLVKRLKEKGLRIDAVGMQCHMGLNHPDFAEEEASIEAFVAAGVRVQFTEVDMSILPNPYDGADINTRFDYTPEKDPYRDGVPEEKMKEWRDRFQQFFALVNRHAKDVNRVTFWGVGDETSWMNDYPIQGRKDYALPFGRDGKFKFE